MNTLFLHLFVAHPNFTSGGAKDIVRVEDHDDLLQIFTEQTKALSGTYGNYFLAELIEAQDEENHAAVCESDGAAVGFISVSGDINVTMLNECFELGPFNGLQKTKAETPPAEALPRPDPPLSCPARDVPEAQKPNEGTDAVESKSLLDPPNAFRIQLFVIDKRFEMRHPTLPPCFGKPPVALTSMAHENEGMLIFGERAPAGAPSQCPPYCPAVLEYGVQPCPPPLFLFPHLQMLPPPPPPNPNPNPPPLPSTPLSSCHHVESVDFLPYVFKQFPDRDFCIISVPKLAPEFPLLQSFLRVVPHHTSNLPQELYIFPRAGLLKTFDVRVALSTDMPAVQHLVEQLSLHESLLDDLDSFLKARRDLDGTPLLAVVAEVEKQIVGVLIIKDEQDIEYIRAHYNIENFIYFSYHRREEHGQLSHFALNPTFQHYARHFLKEALRLAHKSCLYYPIYPPVHQQRNSCGHYLTAALNYMVPVRPRRQIVLSLEELGMNAPSQHITKEQPPYALNHFSRKLTMEPKVTINAQIVVVGASDTGLSFLEAFVFWFNNITLISTHGIPASHSKEASRFLATSGHGYCARTHAQLSLRSWINIVTGKMVGIDRASKHVLVTGGRRVPYDHLILCTGEQFQIPCPTGVDISKLASDGELPPQPRQRYTGLVPSNLFTLNDELDCQAAYTWLNDSFIEQQGDTVVYGGSIDAYSCVEALLAMGISGSRIHMVHPPSDSQDSCFCDPTVAKAVMSAMDKSGIHVHSNCLLAQWNDGQHPDPITSASFTTDGPPLRLECSVFLNLSSKGVDYDAFKTINDACLVFDGRLVIDTTFHTNDSTIRAAGPMTKFARRYHAEQWRHGLFNSREVGRALAATLLPFFDPTLELVTDPPPDLDRLIPLYSQAKVQGARLPGGFSYLHVVKPAVNFTKDLDGRDIITGRTETGNYFRLHLNRHNMVDALVCLSIKPLPVSNFLCLYGKHEQLLNHLCSRCDEGLVHDLYSYFRERWCLAIYHDRFPDFEEEMHQIMESSKIQLEGDAVSVPELIRRLAEGKLEITEDPELFLKNSFEKSEGLTSLKKSALNYLKYNRYHLTMYAQPGLL
ncbi:hypothetical protein ACEWY4_021671 [Coilia grayii]|uniref:Cilia- and flagella-associated protein 61 N-terminal domain-containing protein n=1 Tax=Coilia grayii TaxID=363190 RepID=A0ABD1J3U4_9TELE